VRFFGEALYRVLLTLWVGGLWAIGYLAAPMLFATLGDRQLAGLVAGKMFAVVAWIGLVAGAYLIIFQIARYRGQFFKRAAFWLVLVMAGMAAVQLFGIQPLMAQLKLEALPREVMESVLRDRFATWHGISSVLYLMQSVLGVGVILWSERGLK
jgi:hypothetical protein